MGITMSGKQIRLSRNERIVRFITVLTLLFSCLFCVSNSSANDLQISDVNISSPDATAKTINVTMSLSWKNSWKNFSSYDAVWVFVKYSKDSGATWSHATLDVEGTNPSGFSAGAGTGVEIVVPSDKKGCFVQRSSVGAGVVEVTDVVLVWDWNADGLTEEDSARVKVFGIEMVHISEGNFYLGDGDGATESSTAFHLADGSSAVQIISGLTNDIKVNAGGSDDAQLTGAGIGLSGSGIDFNNDGTIDNLSFPVGYNEFYAMKYEITEGQWIDFFNMLSTSEKANHDITGTSGKNTDVTLNRNTVSWSGVGSATTNRADRACGYLSWMDVCAYADWAALRPISETEFEKISRGPNSAQVGSFPWGTTSITAATTVSGDENGTETITNTAANSCYGNQTFSGGDGNKGPVRAGIFANSESTRSKAGAGFYGVMELGGNLSEPCVSLGHAAGRNFQGSHGDGVLLAIESYEGNATNDDWPGYVQDQGVSSASGSGRRGGSWSSSSSSGLATSSRDQASAASGSRNSAYGGRAGRSVS
jgi:formylglycine-generating enzyme required for sulfatase activity